MSRPAPAPLPRYPHTIIGVALLAGLASASLLAQQGSSSCGLLQVAELEAAIGGKASAKPSGSKQALPDMTLDACSVVLGGSGVPHTVNIRLVTKLNVGMDAAQALMIRNKATASEKQWKVAGAKLEQATVGKAICILSGRPDVASHAICSIPRGDGYVELDVVGDVTNLPSLATVGALVQKANSRL